MEIKESRQEDVVILQPSGSVDTRTAFEFEQHVVQLLESGARRFVVDFAQVEQLASSGIRVLLMLAKKLAGAEGQLVLCGLSQHVKTVLDISGLSSQFTIVPSTDEAVASLSSGEKMSRVSVVAMKLLDVGGGEPAVERSSKGAQRGQSSRLSQHVAKILSGSPEPAAAAPDASADEPGGEPETDA